jgi:thioredoxin reductase (NADPH)
MYQLIIVGAGPAGLTAALFAQRYGLNYLLIGQPAESVVNQAHLVENYPGVKPMSGPQLIKEFQKHSALKIKREQVKQILPNKQKKTFQIITNQGRYQSQAIILALGMKVRKLGIKNEEKFLNKQIFYYSPDNIALFKNKTVAVIGGGDTALTTALKLADQTKKVYLIHRRDEFRGAPLLVKRVKARKNIEIIHSAQVIEARGQKSLSKIILNTQKELAVDNLFIEIGGVPNVLLCQDLKLKMDNNFVVTDKNQATSLPGLFVAGDMTDYPLKLIVTATSQGAMAATSAYNYLKRS